jgi:hypothetical protein
MLALLEKACVVDNPSLHGFALRHRGKGIPGSLSAHLPIAPSRVDGEMQQTPMHRILFPGIGACTGGNGLDAFEDVANGSEIFL